MKLAALLVSLLAALVVASTAAAGLPGGFSSSDPLALRVTYITLKPVAVYCAATDAGLQAAPTARNAPRDVLGRVDFISGETIYLSPTICTSLLAQINQRAVDWLRFGASLQVLAHEAEHLANHSGQGETECAALAILPNFARTQFGIRKGSTLATIMRGAWSRHRAAEKFSAAYRGTCG